MKRLSKKHKKIAGIVVTILAVGSGIFYSVNLRGQLLRDRYQGIATASVEQSIYVGTPMQYNIAQRLEKRLYRRTGKTFRAETVRSAIAQRQTLLGTHLTADIVDIDGVPVGEIDASPFYHPLWLSFVIDGDTTTTVVNTERIQNDIRSYDIPGEVSPLHADIVSLNLTGAVKRIETDVYARHGQILDRQLAGEDIAEALLNGENEVELAFTVVEPHLRNRTGVDLGEMKLLASGRSNYRGSSRARKENVEKALTEHVHNALIAPGEKFSFNNTLNGPVTLRNGWSMAKVIIRNEEGIGLESQPGGGICQASTTVYRAALHAGLPVKDRRSHSLYVQYYEKHGIGIDATIYPGQQDLSFVNDTGNFVLIQAYDDGDNAFVHLYGTDDGRQVALEGPYFATTAPKDLRIQGRKMYWREIAWKQRVTYPDGREFDDVIVSRYKEIPARARYLYAKKPEPTLHASAGATEE